jgi:hypothetical protein
VFCLTKYEIILVWGSTVQERLRGEGVRRTRKVEKHCTNWSSYWEGHWFKNGNIAENKLHTVTRKIPGNLIEHLQIHTFLAVWQDQCGLYHKEMRILLMQTHFSLNKLPDWSQSKEVKYTQMQVYDHSQLHLCDMMEGQCWVLVGEKIRVHTYIFITFLGSIN